MMHLTLRRMVDGDTYTLGRLEDAESRQVCVTAERAWVDLNRDGLGDPEVSRIPAGTYTCHRDIHGKTGPLPYQVWELENVPGRSEIHIHIGNDPGKHSKGCILVGTTWGAGGTINNSRSAFDTLMRLTEGHDEITLTVVDAE